MKRRDVLALGAATASAPARLALGQAARSVLRFAPIADLGVVDPIVTTTYITRNHGYLVWDTLYGLDEQVRPQPQMAEGHAVEEGGRRVLIRLRPGLRFHDGEPVLARDCVASIRRWAARDPLGQTLMALTDELSAPDDRTVLFRLRRPFPMLFDALAKTSPPVCFVMPERLARADPAQPIREVVGSGPFRFLPAERVSGARVAYARFEGYVPNPEGAPSGTAGPKVAHFDRVEWVTMPDAATAAAALQAGEVDWWEFPTPDLLPLLRRRADLVVENPDPFGFMGVLRFNHLHPPFDDPAARRALLPAVAQADYMTAAAGTDRAAWRDGVGFFPPGAPMAGDAGMEALAGPRSLAEARQRLSAAGHAGARATVIGPTDYPNVRALTEVGVDMLRRTGLDLDYAPSDWATVVQRRANREAPARGGWNALFTFFSGLDFLNPGVHLMLRANGTAAWPGWPTSPRPEELRQAWFEAPDAEARRRLAEEVQRRAFEDLPYVPLGQFFQPTAFRRTITGVLRGPTVFWNVRRTA
ncbi:MAG: ABC transporter substrate-binding protein [Acetobacteraceae bacterium]|nr:ABC transporter substrate-binding protein [Acetobacteraceae bacterium]